MYRTFTISSNWSCFSRNFAGCLDFVLCFLLEKIWKLEHIRMILMIKYVEVILYIDAALYNGSRSWILSDSTQWWCTALREAAQWSCDHGLSAHCSSEYQAFYHPDRQPGQMSAACQSARLQRDPLSQLSSNQDSEQKDLCVSSMWITGLFWMVLMRCYLCDCKQTYQTGNVWFYILK